MVPRNLTQLQLTMYDRDTNQPAPQIHVNSLYLNPVVIFRNDIFFCSEANRICGPSAATTFQMEREAQAHHQDATGAPKSNEMHPYESYVAAQCQNNPCLANLEGFLTDSMPERNTCRMASFDFVCHGAERAHLQYRLLQPDDLMSAVYPLEDGLKGRVLVVEDLSRNTVNTLGSMLDIDPLFFASHIHASSRTIRAQTPNLATLPSRIRSQNYVSVQYHRALELPRQFEAEHKLVRATNVCRKVAVLPPTRNTCIGLVQHCCSIYFCKKTKNRDNWLCK